MVRAKLPRERRRRVACGRSHALLAQHRDSGQDDGPSTGRDSTYQRRNAVSTSPATSLIRRMRRFLLQRFVVDLLHSGPSARVGR
jgi:hypothetical protein